MQGIHYPKKDTREIQMVHHSLYLNTKLYVEGGQTALN